MKNWKFITIVVLVLATLVVACGITYYLTESRFKYFITTGQPHYILDRQSGQVWKLYQNYEDSKLKDEGVIPLQYYYKGDRGFTHKDALTEFVKSVLRGQKQSQQS